MHGLEQWSFLLQDAQRIVNRKHWRWLTVWFAPSFLAVLSYRFNRCGWLNLGRGWSALSILLSPLAFVIRPLFPRCEIHYRANIAGGMIILHPSLGVVISANTVAGTRLTLTGGNCIGGRGRGETHRLGCDVTLGVNACVIGDVTLGSRVMVGAGAVVVSDCGDDQVLAGVPAKPLRTAISAS